VVQAESAVQLKRVESMDNIAVETSGGAGPRFGFGGWGGDPSNQEPAGRFAPPPPRVPTRPPRDAHTWPASPPCCSRSASSRDGSATGSLTGSFSAPQTPHSPYGGPAHSSKDAGGTIGARKSLSNSRIEV